MRKVICLAVLMLLAFGGSAWGADIGVTLNGTAVTMDASTGTPYMDPAGRVMVPLRVVLEKAGAHVEYDTLNRLVSITTVDKEILVPIGQSFVVVNHENKANDAPAQIRNDRTYLPIRIVMESLGYEVRWDSGASKVLITNQKLVEKPSTIPVAPVVISANEQAQAPNVIGNSNINLYNGGLVARENNWLYYVNFEDNERIWRVDVTTGKSNAVSARKGMSINVVDGWVYYREQTMYGNWEVHKTKGDGTEDVVVVSENTEWLMVKGDTIYFYQNNPSGLYRRMVNGNSNVKLTDIKMTGINMDNSTIVYVERKDPDQVEMVNSWNVVKFKLEDSTKITIATIKSNQNPPLAMIANNKLLFAKSEDADSLYYQDLLSDKIQKLTDQSVRNVSFSGTSYYTIFPQQESALYEVAGDGSSVRKIGDQWIQMNYTNPSIQASGKYIYYTRDMSTDRYQLFRVDPSKGEIIKISIPSDLKE